MANEIRWDTSQIQAGLVECGRKVHQAVIAVCTYVSPLIHRYAVENHRWTDRTSNAAQGLNSFVEEVSKEIVRVYLAGGVDYQIWLEVRFAGAYAIIWESLQAHFETITKMLRDIFK